MSQITANQLNASRDTMPVSLRTPGVAFEAVKRLIDIAGSLAAGLACLPVLMFCALWIKAMDGGPVLYTQWRVGQDGWLFRIYKFRTMTQNAEAAGIQWAKRQDPRVLRGCSWMRRSHVDELPQLWNILTGDMSLVGPRPERPEMTEQLRRDIPRIERRLAARPGLTGLAQLRNGYTNDIAGSRRKIAWDLRYLRQRTITGDVLLMLQTIPKFWDKAAL